MQSVDSPVHTHPNLPASQVHALERQAEWPPAQSTASAIQRLSPDILYEIFANCLPSILSDELSRVAPFNLSTVCRLWREVVLGSPVLWASLEFSIYSTLGPFPPEYTLDTSPSRILSSLGKWLEFSKCSPVDINLHISTGDVRVPEEIVQIIQVAFRSQNRWRNCEVYFSSNEESPILSGIDTVLRCQHHLKNLDIFFANGRCQDVNYYRLDTQHAKNLSALSVYMGFFTLPVGRMNNLASLEVTIPVANFSALLRVFRNAPNLLKASIDIRGNDYVGPQSTSRITLNKLEEMKLNMDKDNLVSLSRLLDCLCAPSLRKLEFATLRMKQELHASNVWTDLNKFIECSRPPLETLVLQSRTSLPPDPRYQLKPRGEENPTSDELIINMLKGLPTLKQLDIGGVIASSRLFNALARDRAEASGGVLCPLLKEIFEVWTDYDRFKLLQHKPESTTFREFWNIRRY